MTNLQEAANQQQRLLQQRLLLGLPILVGGVIAVAITATITVPQFLRLQENSAKLQQLQELQQRIPLLRAQLDRTSTDQQLAKARQSRVLQLIEGSGEFVTFLAQLDREAARNGLQLELFEPVAAAPPPDAPPAKGGNQTNQAPPPAPKAPLEQAGLSAERVLLTARGRYPNLLAFMRAMEKLSLLVVPSNFSLELVEVGPPPAGAGPNAAKPTLPEMKVALTYYKAPEGGLKQAQPNAPSPAAPAAGNPAENPAKPNASS
jgi:type IV pilus assembly protein PilO